ncbi:MAG: hypothetical protein KAT29_06985, partial [Anaerolineales bacterium]|nr:hypothetical protein [Anaerolineales bacterium]
MVIGNTPEVRHTMETDMLRQALQGDASAANSALKYLSSANPTLRRIMQEAIYDLTDARIWSKLLRCLS